MEPKIIDGHGAALEKRIAKLETEMVVKFDFWDVAHRIGAVCGFLALSRIGWDVGHFWSALILMAGAGLCLGSVISDLWAARPWR